MSHSGNIVSLFVTLFICTLDGYSMMNYRVATKRAYGYFAAVTAVCLAFKWGWRTRAIPPNLFAR